MTVSFGTETNILKNFTSKQEPQNTAKIIDFPTPQNKGASDIAEISKKDTSKKSEKTSEVEKKKYSFKTFIADVASAWINFKEITKGVFKGLFGGFVAASAVVFTDKISAGLKALKAFNKNPEMVSESVKKLSKLGKAKDSVIRSVDVFKAAFAKGTTKGKVIAGLIGAAVFAGYVIAARLRANLKTANVDHALHEGHRDK